MKTVQVPQRIATAGAAAVVNGSSPPQGPITQRGEQGEAIS